MALSYARACQKCPQNKATLGEIVSSQKAVSIVNTVTDGDARAMHGARLPPSFRGKILPRKKKMLRLDERLSPLNFP